MNKDNVHPVRLDNDDRSKKLKRTSQMYKLENFQKKENDFVQAKRAIKNGITKFGMKLKNKNFLKGYAKKRIPVIDWLPKYSLKNYLINDLLAGLTVGIMNLPQAMAYSILATLPAVNGLYMSFFPLVIYAVLGTSRHLTIGAIAVLSLLSGDVITRMVNSYEYKPLLVNGTTVNDTAHEAALKEQYRLTVACSLALLVGVIQALMGLCGLGIITSYFSDTFVSSYTSGSAIHGVVSQIKDLFGMKGTNRYEGIFKIPKTLIDLCSKLPNSNWKTILISLFGIVYLLVFKEILNPRIKKKIKVEFPSEFVLVILMTLISYVAKFSSNLGIDTVKTIPSGLPTPQLPDPSLWPSLITDGILIAVIAVSTNLSLAKLFSQKHRYKFDSTQELYAYGGANIFSSFFLCYPSGVSLSRSSVLDAANAKSQAASFFSSIIILVVIIWLGPLFEPLPKSSLACVVVVALKGLVFQVKDLFPLWKINKFEFITWLLTFLGVVLLDVDIGLVIGLGVSIFTIIVRDQLLRLKRQVKSSDRSLNYIDENFIKKIETSQDQTNLKIFKVQSSIYFANCQVFQKTIFKLYGISPYENAETSETKKKSSDTEASTSNPVEFQIDWSSRNENNKKKYLTDHCFVIDLSAVNYIDTNGIKILLQLINDYKKVNVNVYLCNPQDHLVKMAFDMDVLEKFDESIYLSVKDVLKQIDKNCTVEI